MSKIIYFSVSLLILLALVFFWLKKDNLVEQPLPEEEMIACTMDAMQCPDGSYVGRSGPNCEFVCPEISVPEEVANEIELKADLIKLQTPSPQTVIANPLEITGEARGYWFFEGSFPVILTNWDGLIIAESFATAQGEWMTEDFVPFSANLSYENPYQSGDPDFMKRGSLILRKDNPSSLPEHDDALEIPILFPAP